MKNWLIGKDPEAGKDWRQEEKGTTEDELVGWHHQLNGQEFEQAPGVVDRQGSLTCSSPWGREELDTTEQLNWTELRHYFRLWEYSYEQHKLLSLDSTKGDKTLNRCKEKTIIQRVCIRKVFLSLLNALSFDKLNLHTYSVLCIIKNLLNYLNMFFNI